MCPGKDLSCLCILNTLAHGLFYISKQIQLLLPTAMRVQTVGHNFTGENLLHPTVVHWV